MTLHLNFWVRAGKVIQYVPFLDSPKYVYNTAVSPALGGNGG